MKVLLIVFAILLLLLTLLSTFGGSIRPNEPYYEPLTQKEKLSLPTGLPEGIPGVPPAISKFENSFHIEQEQVPKFESHVSESFVNIEPFEKEGQQVFASF